MSQVGYREVIAGTWERPADQHENFFVGVAAQGHPLNVEHFAISATASLKIKHSAPEVVLSSLKSAWQALRFEHPDVAAVVDGGKKTYKVPTDADLESWTSTTFHVHETATSDQDILPIAPEKWMSLHWLPKASKVILHSSHWRIDAIGMAAVFGNLLTSLGQNLSKSTLPASQLSWGEEVSRLTIGMEDWAGNPETPSKEAVAFVDHETSGFLKHLPSVSFPDQAPAEKLPGKTAVSEVTISKASTSEVIAATKKQGLSVTAAWNAAIATALYEIVPDNHKDRGYTGIIPMNIRAALQAASPDKNPRTICASYVSGVAPLVPAGLNWKEQADFLQKTYAEYRSPVFLSALKERGIRWGQVFAQLPSLGLPAPMGASLSSIGIIDDYIKPSYEDHVEVEGWRVDLEVIDRQVALYLLTFQDRMQLSVNWNKEFYERSIVESFVARVIAVLCRELGINIDYEET